MLHCLSNCSIFLVLCLLWRNMFFKKHLRVFELGRSMGRFGSGLCPTRNRPDHFKSLKLGPAADQPEATVRVVERCRFSVGFRSGSNCANRRRILPKSAYFCLIDQISKRSQLDQARSRRDPVRSQRDLGGSRRDQARSRRDLAGSRQIGQNRPANYFNLQRKLFPVGFLVKSVENRFSML